MQHRIEGLDANSADIALLVGDIELLESEPGMRPQLLQPGALERRVVIGVQVVDAEHLVPALEQALARVHADEPRRACHQDLHA